MCKVLMSSLIVFLKIISCHGQIINYGEICTSTDECSDHRYACIPDQNNTLRCLCNNLHVWVIRQGCRMKYNATEIMNMTVVVKDLLTKKIEDEATRIITAQLSAGLFVVAMVIIACMIVTIFCIYINRQDYLLLKSVKTGTKTKPSPTITEESRTVSLFKPSTSSMV